MSTKLFATIAFLILLSFGCWLVSQLYSFELSTPYICRETLIKPTVSTERVISTDEYQSTSKLLPDDKVINFFKNRSDIEPFIIADGKQMFFASKHYNGCE
ncbi:MAG: hypothetical protein AB1489_11315 [Acidobacteriota bacterium]